MIEKLKRDVHLYDRHQVNRRRWTSFFMKVCPKNNKLRFFIWINMTCGKFMWTCGDTWYFAKIHLSNDVNNSNVLIIAILRGIKIELHLINYFFLTKEVFSGNLHMLDPWWSRETFWKYYKKQVDAYIHPIIFITFSSRYFSLA